MELYSISAGGHKGDKDGYTIPAGTDIFLSVRRSIYISFSPCAYTCAYNILLLIPFWVRSSSIFRYIISIDLRIFGTDRTSLSRRDFWCKKRAKALKDGPVLIHLEALAHYIQMRCLYSLHILLKQAYFDDLTIIFILNELMGTVAISDNIRFCLLTLWRRTKKMCWRPICPNGVYGCIGYVAAKVRRGVERFCRIGGIGHRGNNAHKEWIVVQVKKERWCPLT